MANGPKRSGSKDAEGGGSEAGVGGAGDEGRDGEGKADEEDEGMDNTNEGMKIDKTIQLYNILIQYLLNNLRLKKEYMSLLESHGIYA